MAQVDDTIRDLNPAMDGLIDMEGDNAVLRNGVHHAKLGLADEKPYRCDHDGSEILGGEVPLFLKQGGEFVLTRWFLYADRRCELGYATGLMSVDDVETMMDDGQVTTSVPDNAWIVIPGLGRFRSKDGIWCVQSSERVREALDQIAMAGGEDGCVHRCREAHERYEENPSDDNRNQLRLAYEAVPEHLRLYCGDMDSKDRPTRRILYGDETE